MLPLPELTNINFERTPAPSGRSDFRQERENHRSSAQVSRSPTSPVSWATSTPCLNASSASDLRTDLRASPLRIVIAETQDFSRDAVAQLCQNELGHEIVGLARDGQEAIDLVGATQPDLLILDLYLLKHDGFEVTEVARCLCPKIKMVVFTAAREPYTLYRIERIGFNAYVDKNDRAADSLRTAIESIASGRRYFAPSLISEKKRRQADPLSFDKLLTDREKEVLGLVGQCLNNEEIGALLGIAPKTAETFRHRLLKKLDVAGTPKLIRFAIDHGFTQFLPTASAERCAFPTFINPPALSSPLSRTSLPPAPPVGSASFASRFSSRCNRAPCLSSP